MLRKQGMDEDEDVDVRDNCSLFTSCIDRLLFHQDKTNIVESIPQIYLFVRVIMFMPISILI